MNSKIIKEYRFWFCLDLDDRDRDINLIRLEQAYPDLIDEFKIIGRYTRNRASKSLIINILHTFNAVVCFDAFDDEIDYFDLYQDFNTLDEEKEFYYEVKQAIDKSSYVEAYKDYCIYTNKGYKYTNNAIRPKKINIMDIEDHDEFKR